MAERPARKDAQRNRTRLLETAAQVFHDVGADAPLDLIAVRAGVSNATLYRHFPTRRRLLTAVYAQTIDALCAEARTRVGDGDDDALFDWFGVVVDRMQASRGLRETLVAAYALVPDEPTPEVDEWHERIRDAAEPLFTRALQRGRIRPSMPWTEVLALVTAVAGAAGPDRTAAARMLAVVIAGLRAPERAAHRTAPRTSPPEERLSRRTPSGGAAGQGAAGS
ncbi:TetR/AcrR family transcriptional regulator [Streptomyces griseus]|uniref:TetR/AcrR family transcriptional regulator n=1 Tax=Streptomyces griseus TaxID=1911 RepID=UPI00068FFCDC|nr:TetR/AcrR family transcriptional regulator [Streptomyces griseus]